MGSFIPNTKAEQEEMLKAAGFESFDELFADIPEDMRLKTPLDIPGGMSEMEAAGKMEEMAGKNKVFRTILRGAGAYDHYIPSIVKSITGKETFVTAYTPYQAEISQGILQSIFEYQTMMCELTGMDVSDASVYDGATAAAEALTMCRDRKRTVALVSATTDPKIIEVMKEYCFGSGCEIRVVPEKFGQTDKDKLREMLTDDVASFLVQQPNYYGLIEDAESLGEMVHEAKAKYIMSCNPVSLAILKTPGECGADVAVGEGQSLGMPLAYGGPYLGFMTATQKMMRQLPGRIIGETTDHDGRKAYVLTLQAREQHIRREKASSNICSNQALCAMTAAAYLSAVGADGFRKVAEQCVSKAHYLRDGLDEAGMMPTFGGEFFHEFVMTCPGGQKQVDTVLKALEEQDILGGLPLGSGRILWCATEKNTRAELDKAIGIVKEVLEGGASR
ncbi:MAG: aminomethyl-transferring glycine dehydrogenase subunit GcvPA [Clostridia bacterium]|nr:aminomethyl-transferring glycine dehydrogenase subunit GcvPA [Clostridia bacterium]